MNVLVACEFSGIVRDAFIRKGHNAWSCDLLPSDSDNSTHIQGDVLNLLEWGKFDLMIAFPPCTHLCVSGARWWIDCIPETQDALNFVWKLMNCKIPKIAIENPIGLISTCIRKPDQIIQPWWFGHGETKSTCLWLKNLSKLKPTNIVEGREPRVHWASPGKDRWKERSRTLQGIADAMVEQWGIE